MLDTGNCLYPARRKLQVSENLANNRLIVNVCLSYISRCQLLQALIQPFKKSVRDPGSIYLSSLSSLSILALIFRVVLSWLQDGCSSFSHYICIQGRNWKKTEVTPISRGQGFTKKTQVRPPPISFWPEVCHKPSRALREALSWHVQPL